jgi:hypothetical protein
MRPVTLAARSLLDLPIALFEVLDNGSGDLVLLVLGQRAAHAAYQAKPFSESHHDTQAQLVGST